MKCEECGAIYFRTIFECRRCKLLLTVANENTCEMKCEECGAIYFRTIFECRRCKLLLTVANENTCEMKCEECGAIYFRTIFECRRCKLCLQWQTKIRESHTQNTNTNPQKKNTVYPFSAQPKYIKCKCPVLVLLRTYLLH
ncbi:Arabinose 5-phosphate isomerase [hydrothermal vent metagenome]|uniref:Arabinose 5-phosphate isomerase n=1 Tax=hydrothermal vent metagenome TaxID=652676 RepID=A0A3B0UN96_9ZZZZ